MTRRPLCRATTHAGRPCRNRSAAGSAYCGSHGGGARVGQPLKLTADVHARILEHIAKGATYEVAAGAAGIHRDTFRVWREQGDLDLAAGRQSAYSDLSAAVPLARASREVELAGIMLAHARLDWRAAAWLLEHDAEYAQRWARREHVDLELVERAEPRTVTPAGAERAAILELLASATSSPSDRRP